MKLPGPRLPSLFLAAALGLCITAWTGFAASVDGDQFWDATFGVPGADASAAVVFGPENNIFAGGNFSMVGGIEANRVARWDGKNWYPLNGGVGIPGGGGLVESLTTDENHFYVGGNYYSASGTSVNNIARWDGTNWLPLGSGLNDAVLALTTDGQNLYAGGNFTFAGGQPASKIARWDGTNWHSLGQGIIPVNFGGTVVGAVDSIAVGGGSVYVGGRFRIAGGVAATNIARWDGMNWHALGGGLRYSDTGGPENGAVRSLLFNRGTLHAGGSFSIAGTTPLNNIAQWNRTNWSPVGTGVGASGSVQTIIPNGSDVYIGGSFLNLDGQYVRGIAKWDGGNWSALGGGFFGGPPLGLATTGSELFVGGAFTVAGDKSASRIAMWHIPHPLAIQRARNTVTLSRPIQRFNDSTVQRFNDSITTPAPSDGRVCRDNCG